MSNNIKINYLSFLNSYIEDCALLHIIYIYIVLPISFLCNIQIYKIYIMQDTNGMNDRSPVSIVTKSKNITWKNRIVRIQFIVLFFIVLKTMSAENR